MTKEVIRHFFKAYVINKLSTCLTPGYKHFKSKIWPENRKSPHSFYSFLTAA